MMATLSATVSALTKAYNSSVVEPVKTENHD